MTRRLRPLRLRALHELLTLERAHTVEVGANNAGAAVARIIAYAGGQPREPYCVDGVIWAYGHAGSTVVRPGFPRAVRSMLQPGLHVARSWRPGHIVRFVFDHTGLLVGFRRLVAGRFVPCPRRLATHLLTVEANTGRDGAVSDGYGPGDGVHRRLRPLELVRDVLAVDR